MENAAGVKLVDTLRGHTSKIGRIASYSDTHMNTTTFSNNDIHTAKPNSYLPTLCWSVTANLLSFFCLAHLIVMLCFSVG